MAAAAGIAATAFETLQLNLRRQWQRDIDLPELSFYTSVDSIVAGTNLAIAFHAPEGAEFTIARFSERVDQPVVSLTVDPVGQSSRYDYWRGLDWSETSIETNPNWRPGLYLLELRSGTDVYRQALIVSSPNSEKIGVVLSTNTWAAYNSFGGLSNYLDSVTPWPLRAMNRVCKVMDWQTPVGDRHVVPTIPLPFHRPNDRIDLDLANVYADPVVDFSHLVRADWALLRFLDSTGEPYNLFSDSDLAFGRGPAKSRLLIFGTHSEYWSEEMIAQFVSFRDKGGRALFVSGNNWYRSVKFLERGLQVTSQKVDPHKVAGHLGTGYTADGYDSYSSYRVVDGSHQVFEGLNAETGRVFGGPDEMGRGASGHETDKINSSSGVVDILAIGNNAEGPAFLTWKDHPSGGWVCNFSSVRAAPWLERCETMGGIVRNAMELGVR